MIKLTTGTYETSKAFKEITHHAAVCYGETMALVALTGPASEANSHQWAELFSQVPAMLALLEEAQRLLAHTHPDWVANANVFTQQGKEIKP